MKAINKAFNAMPPRADRDKPPLVVRVLQMLCARRAETLEARCMGISFGARAVSLAQVFKLLCGQRTCLPSTVCAAVAVIVLDADPKDHIQRTE